VKDGALSSVAHSRQVELTAELDRLAGLLREMGAGEVWLFGSLAHGEVHEGSDMDLLVVMDTALPFVKRLAYLYRKLRPRVATDLFVYTPEEMADLRVSNPLVRTALRAGRRL
jgi:predicted nucleotidyltransferase